ncbi:hypothetical protein SAMN05444156_2067 [Verrucomicrobium sp. GAS474]|uniref:hypothetical protein n=1 Tax=Verrucomicrobium sp. GAS474 TaxID=1882831 RepID=UPI000879B4C6|nr:hypothetical protein [Verrucomicrobium sp. GAS474]SDU11927.1 hypothetical protein SAMN05444156_2067 [Verrucomicrobium sp. GAS474]
MNPSSLETLQAWNEAHRRLLQFLGSFALADESHVARLALRILDTAREQHRADPTRHPTTLTLELAQQEVADWLSQSLGAPESSFAGNTAPGRLALLLSDIPLNHPDSFLISPLSDELKQSMRRPLLVVGPDLTLSSMTPRRLDYGPIHDLANQTWHRWNPKEGAAALLLWAVIYVLLYHWLSRGS